MLDMDRGLALLLIIALASTTISFILHMPPETYSLLTGAQQPYTPTYTDIVDGYYRRIFMDQKLCSRLLGNSSGNGVSEWRSYDTALKLCRAEPVIPVPYRDYRLKLPPLDALLWFASTTTAILATGYRVLPSPYTSPNDVALGLSIHYIVYSAITYVAVIVIARTLYGILEKLEWSPYSKKLLYIVFALPTFIVYVIYSYEAVAVALLLLSIKYLLEEKFFRAGLFIGASSISSLFMLAPFIVVVYELMQEKSLDRIARVAAGFAIPFSTLLIVAYYRPTDLVELFLGKGIYCENCIYLYLTGDPGKLLNRSLSIVALAIALPFIMAVEGKRKGIEGIVDKIPIALLATISLHFLFKPQYLLLASLLVPLLIDSLKYLLGYITGDLLNALIILLWFKDKWLREVLGFLGSQKVFNPVAPDSPIQIIATVRAFLLFIIVLYLLYKFTLVEKVFCLKTTSS